MFWLVIFSSFYRATAVYLFLNETYVNLCFLMAIFMFYWLSLVYIVKAYYYRSFVLIRNFLCRRRNWYIFHSNSRNRSRKVYTKVIEIPAKSIFWWRYHLSATDVFAFFLFYSFWSHDQPRLTTTLNIYTR